jgi:xylan 1,4-beta-xylosidase
VRAEADINALATKDAKAAAVMVWHYHNDNLPAPDAPVFVQIAGVPVQRILIQPYRIDKQFRNSYEVWKKMDSFSYLPRPNG